jgi:MraZ protein
LLFVGTHELSIDDKGRVAIPSQMRSRLVPAKDGQGLYGVLLNGPVLALYTERGFEQLAEQLDRSERLPGQVIEYERAQFPLAEFLEIDKQGRVRLPQHLLTETGLAGEVAVIGVRDHMEIHPLGAWKLKRQQILATPGLLMNPREVMRNPISANPT